MFQIAFGLGSDSQHAIWYNDIIRELCAIFDTVVYTLIKFFYTIFFNIASSEIIDSQIVKEFYGRVQLILGVVMIFKLSVSLLQVIITPELLTDQKKGFGKIISRIVVMLVMFVAIIPLSIPANEAPKNSYNAYLNQNGVLFGTLYSLQYRILDQNTIAKLVYADTTSIPGATATTQKAKEKEQRDAGDQLAGYILKTFVTKNTDKCPNPNAGATEIYDEYDQEGASYLLSHITDTTCYTTPGGNEAKYALAYFPVVSTICGLIVLICLISFCIDIAIRSIKLATLRLIAPIPIISYIDPKSSENGAFANWVKMLISTYIDLFLRLAIIYFAISLVGNFIENGIAINFADSVTGAIAAVFIIIGIFLFAKQGPKFIKDALGLKGNMQNLGLSSVLAGVGALFTKGSLADAWDAGRVARDAQIEAYNQGKAAPRLFSNFTSGRDLMAQNLTGNPKMTYAQMKRGLGFLAREGITDDYAESKKMDMYNLEDEAEILKNLSDKINQHGYNYDSLNNKEQNLLEKIYREKLNKINRTDAYTKTDGNGQYTTALTTDQYNAIKESGRNAFDLYLDRKTDAGKAKAEYQMISKEQEAHGATPSYREKYQSRRTIGRWSDVGLRDENGNVVFGVRDAVRHVAGVTGNSVRTVGQHHRERVANNVHDRTSSTTVSNEEIERARRRNQP